MCNILLIQVDIDMKDDQIIHHDTFEIMDEMESLGISDEETNEVIYLNSPLIGMNDEVIVPNMTFLATANSVLMTGATPVLADVNLSDYNISVDSQFN